MEGFKLSGRVVDRLRRDSTRLETQPYDISDDFAPDISSGTAVAWQRGVNGSGQTVPAYSCVAVGSIGSTSDGYLASLTQPSGSATAQYGLTGASDCPANGPDGPSLCSFHLEAGWATYDSGSPNPGETWGPKSGQFSLSKGQPGFVVVAVVDAGRQIALVVPQTAKLTRFELYTDLNWGVGTALAHPLKWNGSTWTVDSSVTFSVYDSFFISGNFSAFTGKAAAGAITVGCRGWCQKPSDSGLAEIVWMEMRNKWLRFTLPSQLKYNDTSKAGCTVTDTWQGCAWGSDLPGGTPGTITITNDGTFYGPTGAVGYACWDDNDNQWNIVWLQRQARFAYVSLNADMASLSSSAASVLSFWDGLDPGSTIDVKDPQGFFKRALSGAKMLVTFNERANGATGQYEVVEGQSQAGMIHFVLNGNLSSGSAAANSLSSGDYWGSQQDIQAPTGGTLTVYDKASLFKRSLTGAHGIAAFDAEANKYNVVICDQETLSYRGTLGGTLTQSTSSVSVGSLVRLDSSPYGQAGVASNKTAFNVHKLAGASGAATTIKWNDASSQWEIQQVEHVVQTFVTRVVWDGTNLNQYTMDLACLPNAAEVGPTVIDTPGVCSS